MNKTKNIEKLILERFGLPLEESELQEGVNFWNQEYHYNPKKDSTDDLVQGALRWYHFDKNVENYSSPSDERFIKKLSRRMMGFGIDNHAINNVVNKLKTL